MLTVALGTLFHPEKYHSNKSFGDSLSTYVLHLAHVEAVGFFHTGNSDPTGMENQDGLLGLWMHGSRMLGVTGSMSFSWLLEPMWQLQ